MLSAKRSCVRCNSCRDLRIARTRAKTGGVTHGECICAWRGEVEVLVVLKSCSGLKVPFVWAGKISLAYRADV
jgi:hypothetical protein